MKKIFHKNQLIITTLAFMLAIAGYISYDRINNKNDVAQTNADAVENGYVLDTSTYDIFEEEETAETMGEELDAEADPAELALEDDENVLEEGEEYLNPGETVLTSLNVTGANYAAEVKLNREQVRSKNKEALLEIIDNDTIGEEQKQDAINEMVALTDIAEKEANAEMLLEAKGFTNVVVSISNETCDVVVDMGDVTDAKRAQVEDIVKRKTGISAENIIITPISVDSSSLEQ